MKKLRIKYEHYDNGIIVCDYSNCHRPRFTGESMEWRSDPKIKDPFETELHARRAVRLYFTGKQT